MLIAIMKDNINVCQTSHNLTTTSQSRNVFTTYANIQNTSTLIIIDANHNVRKLIGHDNVFSIHFIGELKTQNINPRTKKAQTKLIIDFSTSGFEKLILIPIEQ